MSYYDDVYCEENEWGEDIYEAWDEIDELKDEVKEWKRKWAILKEENNRLLGIIKQYETVEHEWHAENGAVIKDVI